MTDAIIQCARDGAPFNDVPLQSKRNRAFSLRVLKTRDSGAENGEAPERMYCIALRREDKNSVDVTWWSNAALCAWLRKHRVAQPAWLSLAATS